MRMKRLAGEQQGSVIYLSNVITSQEILGCSSSDEYICSETFVLIRYFPTQNLMIINSSLVLRLLMQVPWTWMEMEWISQ